MSHLRIAGRGIGPGEPTFVIAEIGVNHDGRVERAVELVEHAAAAGADAVKLQLFDADRLMSRDAAFAGYQRRAAADDSPAAMLRRLQLTRDDIGVVVAEARRRGLAPLATPFSPEDVDAIESLDLPAIKIASPDLVNLPLLRRCAATGRPLLVSCGAATMEEVRRACAWMEERGAAFALLHCVSAYPVEPCHAHLRWIAELARSTGRPIGYSDHATDLFAGALAAAAGACVVEKHLTWDRRAPGPDHAASADPREFADYVARIRAAEAMLGDGPKRVLEVEQDVRRVSRQSLVARRAIAPGQVLAPDDLIAQRPGEGIPAMEIDRVAGRRAASAIAAGAMLRWEMLA